MADRNPRQVDGDRLVGALLVAIDVSARKSLRALDRDERDAAAGDAARAAELTEHLLSITAAPGDAAPSLRHLAGEAEIAFSHVQELANRLTTEGAGAEALVDALEGVVLGPGVEGRWTWKARALEAVDD